MDWIGRKMWTPGLDWIESGQQKLTNVQPWVFPIVVYKIHCICYVMLCDCNSHINREMGNLFYFWITVYLREIIGDVEFEISVTFQRSIVLPQRRPFPLHITITFKRSLSPVGSRLPVVSCDWLACGTWLRNADTVMCQLTTTRDRFSSFCNWKLSQGLRVMVMVMVMVSVRVWL